jgi:hypothetical protein
MDKDPTSQLLWHLKAATMERRVTVAEHSVSMSVRVEEVTMMSATEMTTASRPNDCPDLELGAHVALLRSVGGKSPAWRGARSPLSVAPRPLPTVSKPA